MKDLGRRGVRCNEGWGIEKKQAGSNEGEKEGRSCKRSEKAQSKR